MREILFRAISIKTGKWVYGHIAYHAFDTAYYIHESWDIAPCMSEPGGSVHYAVHEVDPKTICEYTGLKDKNGVEIFDGDIIKHQLGKVFIVEFEDFGWVVNNEKIFAIKNNKMGGNEKYSLKNFLQMLKESNVKIEVIGNTYQNPELLTTKP